MPSRPDDIQQIKAEIGRHIAALVRQASEATYARRTAPLPVTGTAGYGVWRPAKPRTRKGGRR